MLLFAGVNKTTFSPPVRCVSVSSFSSAIRRIRDCILVDVCMPTRSSSV